MQQKLLKDLFILFALNGKSEKFAMFQFEFRFSFLFFRSSVLFFAHNNLLSGNLASSSFDSPLMPCQLFPFQAGFISVSIPSIFFFLQCNEKDIKIIV